MSPALERLLLVGCSVSMPILGRIGEAGGVGVCNEERMKTVSISSHLIIFYIYCICGSVWRARRAGFRFAETVFFSSIPCFSFVSHCSLYHSVKNAPLLGIRAFDTAENELPKLELVS